MYAIVEIKLNGEVLHDVGVYDVINHSIMYNNRNKGKLRVNSEDVSFIIVNMNNLNDKREVNIKILKLMERKSQLFGLLPKSFLRGNTIKFYIIYPITILEYFCSILDVKELDPEMGYILHGLSYFPNLIVKMKINNNVLEVTRKDMINTPVYAKLKAKVTENDIFEECMLQKMLR